jgi:hypothetical protein
MPTDAIRLSMTNTTPTLLEVLSYLTDPTFTAVVVLVVGTFAALTAINKIGGAR